MWHPEWRQVDWKWVSLNEHIPEMERRHLAGLASHLDAAVGRIASRVEALGMGSTSLLGFFSDNGGVPYMGSSNYPLRAPLIGLPPSYGN